MIRLFLLFVTLWALAGSAGAEQSTTVFSRNATTFVAEAGRYPTRALAEQAAAALQRSRYNAAVQETPPLDGTAQYVVMVSLAEDKQTLPAFSALESRQALRRQAALAAAAAGGRAHYVQLSACLAEESAQVVINRYRSLGYSPRVLLQQDDAGRLWRIIHLGPYATGKQAEHALRRIVQQTGAEPMVRSLPAKSYERMAH